MKQNESGLSGFFTEDVIRAIAKTLNDDDTTDMNSEFEEAAKTTKKIYDAYVSAGFTEKQATKLIVAFVGAAIK